MNRIYARAPRRRSYALAAVAFALAVFVGVTLVGAVTAGSASTLAARAIATQTVARTSVRTMSTIPASTGASASGRSQALPYLGQMPAAQYAAAKQAAKTSNAAPKSPVVLPSMQSRALAPSSSRTPTAALAFDGMADSGATCSYFGSGCQPPDQALAASPNWVMQGVNTSFAVYNTGGTLQAGWPKSAQAFFGVPSVPGCDPGSGNQPFLSDPRLLYDPNDGRFYASILQVEGAFGVGGSCPHTTGYWIAASRTNNPNGAWNIYFLDLSGLTGAGNATDFTMMGVSPLSITLGGDIYNNAGSALTGNFMLSVNKGNLKVGGPLSVSGFTNITLNGLLLNTIQPVISLGHGFGPTADLFAASLDQNFGGGDCTSGCSGIVVLGISNPRSQQSHGPVFSGAVVPGLTYSLPPNAPDGTAGDTVSTNDPRIASTPVYQGGGVWGTVNTAYNNGTQIVPGIYWFQIHPVINHGISGCTLCTSITSGDMLQNSYFAFGGSNSNYYGAIMPDAEGNVFMVSDYSTAAGTHPSVIYESRRTTEALNAFSDGGKFLQLAGTSTADSRWGDYSAASWAGFTADNVWIAAEYSNGDWATKIGRVKYLLGDTN